MEQPPQKYFYLPKIIDSQLDNRTQNQGKKCPDATVFRF